MKKVSPSKIFSIVLLTVLITSSLLATSTVKAAAPDRLIFIRNFENTSYTNQTLFVKLAFIDDDFSAADLTNMHLKDSLNNDVIYQIETYSTYPSGNIASVDVWFLCPFINAQQTLTYSITTQTPPTFEEFGTIDVTTPFINITTAAFQQVSIAYDKGLAWISLQDAEGTQLLKVPNSAVNTNSVLDIRNQEYKGAVATTPDKQIRYSQGISSPANVSYESGALFAKVYWSVTDDYTNTHDGWFRVWAHQPVIEFYTNGTAPVDDTYKQAYVGYRIDSTNAQGTSVNNGTLNYVKTSDGKLALTSVIYEQASNYYGNAENSVGLKMYTEALASGVHRLHCRYDLATYANFDNSAINGKLGVPAAIILKGNHSTVDDAVKNYFAMPVASYYHAPTNEAVKQSTLNLFHTFLTNYKDEFLTGQNSSWNYQNAKAYATLILFGIDTAAQTDNFVSLIEGYTPSSSAWDNAPETWGQSLPNVISSAYYVYKKTGNELVKQEMSRLLNVMADYHQTVKPVQDMYEPINKRKATIEMMLMLGELFPDNANVTLLTDAMATDNNYLYNQSEAFNAYYFPKYQIYGQAYNTIEDRNMYSYTSTNYLVNVLTIQEYDSLDLPVWLRSYGVMQNSIWNRLQTERDDYVFELAHQPQDRLGHTSSYTPYLKTYLDLPLSGGVAGTASAVLSLNYIESLTVDGFIPFADEYILSYQNGSWAYAEGLKGDPVAAGWYSDVGTFEIAVLNYQNSVPPEPTPAPPDTKDGALNATYSIIYGSLPLLGVVALAAVVAVAFLAWQGQGGKIDVMTAIVTVVMVVVGTAVAAAIMSAIQASGI